MMMPNLETLFSIASTTALASWLALILAPRWPVMLLALKFGVVSLLSIAYAVLIGLYFFEVDGGGFGTLAQVKALFTSDPVVLAGWIHYLAFDLFVGLWLAGRFDRAGLSRFVQAPILVATFMFGPVGLLAGYALLAGPKLAGRRVS